MTIGIILIVVSVLALLVVLLQGASINKIKVTDPKVAEIGGFIKEGAMAYLWRQYKVLAIFLAVMLLVLGFALNWMVAICFLFGAILSILAGFFGMRAATSANMRTTEGAKKGLAGAFKVAFSGGSIMGLLVVGLGALGIAVVSLVFEQTDVLTGFSLGASSIALFCRVGGGIYTKAADVGADLVGKVEAGIPEDDPRNPAVIADNVGDNVGDVAGMGSDLFESYVGCIVSAILLAISWSASTGQNFIFMLVGAGILASIIGVLIVRTVKSKNVQGTLNMGTYIASGLLIIASFFICFFAMPAESEYSWWKIFVAIIGGIVGGILIGKLTEIYTSDAYRPVKKISESCKTGAATNILTGLSYGMISTVWPILVIVGIIVLSYFLCGAFGIVLAAIGMLATVGMIISVDAYGPIADNAGGIAEMTGQEESVRDITDHLDSVGNTTAAIGKGFSIGSAALTALALFATYAQTVGLETIDILKPSVIVGLFIGGMLVFLFAALTMSAVSRAANKMIEEVRDQFRKFPGIMKGTEKPDYKRCVDISTRAAIREMLLPGIIAIAAPLILGFTLGKEAVGGLLAGATVVGVLMAILMANAGGAWDNAKKHIEGGAHGGKGSEAHKAAVIGDTVGDPFKDTSGPAMNILIKLMSMVALVFATLFI